MQNDTSSDFQASTNTGNHDKHYDWEAVTKSTLKAVVLKAKVY